MLICSHCNKSYESQAKLTLHLNYINSEKVFECPVPSCKKSFHSKSHLQNHLKTHVDHKPFKCPFKNCPYRAKSKYAIKQHAITHGVGQTFPCEHCDYSASTLSNLRRHLRIHVKIKPYHCPYCPHRTHEIDSLRKHVVDSSIHPGLPLFICPFCKEDKSKDILEYGFNTCSLAWNHLLEKHRDLSFTEGDKVNSSFNEKNVSRIYKVYDPEEDLKLERLDQSIVPIKQKKEGNSSRKKKESDDLLQSLVNVGCGIWSKEKFLAYSYQKT